MTATASIVQAIKRRTPPKLYPLARSVYHRMVAPIECWGVETADRLLSRTYEGRVLPPALMRFKVRGSPSGDGFATIGRTCANDIREALRASGHELTEFGSILDFAAAAAAIGLAPRPRPNGSAERHGHRRQRNRLVPRESGVRAVRHQRCASAAGLCRCDVRSDYAVSVFTHLDEEFQFQWLQNCAASRARRHLPDHAARTRIVERDTDTRRSDLTSRGFVFVRTDDARLVSDWYQTAFHTRSYVEQRFASYFDVVGFVPRGMANHQDVVILQRPINAV
jgi:hypothetical protein